MNGKNYILSHDGAKSMPDNIIVATETSVMGGTSITVNIQGSLEEDKMGNRVMMYRPMTW